MKTKATKQKEFYNDKLGVVLSELSGDHFKVELLEGEKKGEKRKYEGRFLTKIEAEGKEKPQQSDAKRQALDLLGDTGYLRKFKVDPKDYCPLWREKVLV